MKIRTIISWIFQMCIHCCFFLSIWLSWKKLTSLTPFGFKHFLIITHITDRPNLFCFHSFGRLAHKNSLGIEEVVLPDVIASPEFQPTNPKKLTFSWFLLLWHLIVIEILLFLTCSYPKLLLLSARCEDDRQGKWLNISHLNASVIGK